MHSQPRLPRITIVSASKRTRRDSSLESLAPEAGALSIGPKRPARREFTRQFHEAPKGKRFTVGFRRFPGFQVSRNLGFWKPGFQGNLVYRFPGFQKPGFQKPGNQVSRNRVSRNLETRFPENWFPETWKPGFQQPGAARRPLHENLET